MRPPGRRSSGAPPSPPPKSPNRPQPRPAESKAVPIVVHGLRELKRGFANTDREIRLGWRAEMRQGAEPVRRDAEQLALTSIRRMPSSPKWSRMRVGVTQKMVYVAPRQRSTKTPGRRRPNLANLLEVRALDRAGQAHEHQTEARVEQLMDRVAAGFNHG